MVDGPSDSAASTRARLVCDFDPGTRTVARMGTGAIGAGHGPGGATVTVSAVVDTAGESTRGLAGHRSEFAE